ncbi:MAG TPA: hypothetical protein PJ990_16330, partial [Saprospiraceae bacterium]|nr:hypothetical protein [Saprospiraceae bacterium]
LSLENFLKKVSKFSFSSVLVEVSIFGSLQEKKKVTVIKYKKYFMVLTYVKVMYFLKHPVFNLDRILRITSLNGCKLKKGLGAGSMPF